MQKSNTNKELINLVLTALFLALGIVLPFFTGQIPQIGAMLLPMHLPVFFCALICGAKYALPMGFILPLLRSLLFTAPRIFPTATAMAFELATYALVAAIIYFAFKKQGVIALYVSLISAMLCGRIVWGAVSYLLYGFAKTSFSWQIFTAGAFLHAIPGIAIQLVLIPGVMLILDRTQLVRFKK